MQEEQDINGHAAPGKPDTEEEDLEEEDHEEEDLEVELEEEEVLEIQQEIQKDEKVDEGI